ncbi:MAG TPA: D-glycero-beta-D-manno-heptose-7-phosphate kinase [Vicinamibacterales bacterium]|nr:D-glycero-beta-D-manno-heptose-7-phosphate kinase [Vicinamibacterales bacterium]
MILPPLDATRARTLVSRLGHRRVLVVGDVMIDRFIVGTVTRISPEAPVPVVRFQSEHSRLGGAANVAHNLAALGARVALVGMVGTDSAAARLRDQLAAAGLDAQGLVDDSGRPTVEKVRIIAGRNQQVARIDYEDDRDVSGEPEARLIERVVRLGATADVLLVSDYLKGTITRGIMDALLGLKQKGAPLLVDPKIPHLDCYRGATLVTPNNQEAELATLRVIRTNDDARAAAADFRARAACESVLITRGEHGMWLSSDEVEGAIPATAREVADVTGAGDTVVATLALALAAGGSLAEAAVLANHAAGIVVGKFGPATVSPHELSAAI